MDLHFTPKKTHHFVDVSSVFSKKNKTILESPSPSVALSRNIVKMIV
jgi:hypothetical protein